jgi:DNA invertase Pin-like site-specific DNA recombinase
MTVTKTKAHIMDKVVIYARVSSKDQEVEGFSIPAQLKALREYASKNNLRSRIHEMNFV